MKASVLLVAVIAVTAAACGGSESATTLEETTTSAPSTATTSSAVGGDDDLAGVVTESVADLAERLSVDSGEIEVVEAEEVTWSDGSLGCPQPGELYTQALVEGYRVLLRHADQEYAYHAGRDSAPFLCESRIDGGRNITTLPSRT